MKKIISTLLLLAGFAVASFAQEAATDTTKKAGIEFENVVHDFGKIPYGGNGTCDFVFKSTGEIALKLTNVKSSCGCTIPQWPRQPIEVGQSDKIAVKYDTRRTGPFTKGITVYSNAEQKTIRLTIKGEVQPKPATPEE